MTHRFHYTTWYHLLDEQTNMQAYEALNGKYGHDC